MKENKKNVNKWIEVSAWITQQINIKIYPLIIQFDKRNRNFNLM